MREPDNVAGCSVQLETIDELCVGIERAVQGADWAAAGTLLSHRRAALERIFSAPACAPPPALRELAARVIASDQRTGPALATARHETATALKALRAKRVLADAYTQPAGRSARPGGR